MKPIMKTTAVLLCAAGMMLGMACCQKTADEGDTVILLGYESYVVPLMDFMPDTLRTVFPSHFGSMPEGYIPPNIEGEYRIGKKQFCHANLFPIHDTEDMHLRITHQHNRVAHVELDEYGTVTTDTAYIMGNGPKFTLYFTEVKETTFFGAQCSNTRLVVISGEKTDKGIKDLRFGNIILDEGESSDPYITAFVPGMYFIYKDEDGLSEYCDWFDHQEGDGRR